jgi:hypothetical protein
LLGNDTATQCQKSIHTYDTSRAITGNMAWGGPEAVAPDSAISTMLDVMGMSHQQSAKLDAWHAKRPDKLVVMTECCSCETQRGEDADLLQYQNRSYIFNSNENSACVQSKTQISNAVDWVGGTFVWTLHDYYGEPAEDNKWPHISSSFGSFDLAGFAKAPAWWYRSWWLAAINLTDAGRPPLPAASTTWFCRLVESWQSSPKGSTRNLNVYTNAPYARILVNGVPVAPRDTVAVQPFGSASFTNISYVSGNITAECIASTVGVDADGKPLAVEVLASHTKYSWSAPAAIKLTLDVPSVRTGS